MTSFAYAGMGQMLTGRTEQLHCMPQRGPLPDLPQKCQRLWAVIRNAFYLQHTSTVYLKGFTL